MLLSRFLDTALDRTVAPGFSRIGYDLRRRLPGWPADPPPGALRGKAALVTGASSGLGYATAEALARLGAAVHVVVRNETKGSQARDQLVATVPRAQVTVWRCDVSDLSDVRRFVGEFTDANHSLDTIVHNAGVMPARRTESPEGHELTMAVHLLGPLAMTEGLLPVLGNRGSRVIMVTSGGMYAQRLRDDDPEYLAGKYSGTTAYARSKRAQIELLPVLVDRWSPHDINIYATHPGWADTPGIAESLPGFRRLTKPILRDAEAGADTTAWLAATDPPPPPGGLWHDRRPRPTHMRASTRSQPGQVDRIWAWAEEKADLEAH
jgi:dehydrogenase/reductase SDR family member 12